MSESGLGRARHGGWLVAGLVALTLACPSCSGDRAAAPQERNTQLKEGAVARVGDAYIDGETVARIAAAQRISLTEARAKAIHDVLMAEHARQIGLTSEPRVGVEQRGVLAEAFVRTLQREAAKPPSTAEEIAQVTRDHWLDLDRPEARRAVHAVVRVQDKDEPAKVKAAQELAQRIAAAVKSPIGATEFVETAKKFPAEGFEVVAEPLSPVTRDGRVADLEHRPDPGQEPATFDPAFAEALWKLDKPGDQVGPVRSSFGWHVIMFTVVQPGQQYPTDQLAKMLREEIVSRRVRQALDRELQGLSSRVPVRVERNAVAVTQALQPEGQKE